MSKVVLTLFCFALILSGIILIPTKALAIVECKGKITDQNSTPISGAKLALYSGYNANQRVQEVLVSNLGAYDFTIADFGSGFLGTNKVIISAPNYPEKIIDYTSGGNCPGDIILNSTPSTGYICDKGTCRQSSSGAQYGDEASCKADCGIYTYDTGKGLCIPDPSGNIYSYKACQAKSPITSIDKYSFNPNTKTCVPDPNGTTLDECQKKGMVFFTGPILASAGQFCNLDNNGAKLDLRDLPTLPPSSIGILTALGCIPTKPEKLIESFLRFATGAGGGIALLLMIAGAFRMIASSGNPDAIKGGREQFTSALIGLLFIIFSVFLLQVVGVDILQLDKIVPGFGK